MEGEDRSGGVLMIRAWRDADGVLQIRLTEAVAGDNAELGVTTVSTNHEALAAVSAWLDRVTD
jgi:hypothetical protein